MRSRRKSTWRTRLFWASAALILILVPIWWNAFQASLGAAPVSEVALAGNRAFDRTAVLLFIFSLFSGVYVAADSISREKREGTIGLLFMTEVDAHDLVIGKAMVMGIGALSALVSTLPLLAIPLLLGGLGPVEFRHTILLLINTLFFSIAAGIWISTLSFERQTAMTRAFLLLVSLHLPLLFLEAVRQYTSLASGWSVFALPAPFFLLQQVLSDTSVKEPSVFWTGMVLLHLLGWICLTNACWVLTRIWNEDLSDETQAHRRKWWHAFTEQPQARRIARRTNRLDRNPVYWLAGHQSNPAFIIWCVAALTLACQLLYDQFDNMGLVITQLGLPGAFYLPVLISYPVEGCLLVLKALFAMYAARFFVEARHDNRLELLLCAPLSARKIARGNWLMLQRVFQGPVMCIVLMQLILAVSLIKGFQASPNPALTWASLSMFFPFYTAFKLVMDLLVLGWLSMWMAMRLRNPIFASGVALTIILLIPTLIVWVPNLLVDLVLLMVARSNFLHRFRLLATEPRVS